MKKKLFLLLLGLISVVMNVFSTEYQDERNISDIVLIQNTDGKCYVLYKTDDSEVSMYVENHFNEEDCVKTNFFANNETIKATSPFLKKEKYGRKVICFAGTISQTNLEEDNIFIFMSGADYTGYYSKIIPFPKQDNVVLQDFTISDSDEITVYLSQNDNLLSKTINPKSDFINDNYLFSGYKIESFTIYKNNELNESFYGLFISNNNPYAFVLKNNNETITKITDSENYYYLFDDKPVCFFSDGQAFKKITYTDEIILKELSIELDTDNIRDVFEVDNIINIISRDNKNIYSIVADTNLQSFEKTVLCSNETTPFIYIEKNKFFNDSIVIIIKDIGIYIFSENKWNLLEDYKNIKPYINPKLSEISINNEKNFVIEIEINHKDGLFHYVAKLNNIKTIPLYEDYNEEFEVVKNSSSINGLFYTFIKKSENINIFSRMN
ncbi:hypothetical protein [Treponema bryantii]|uniref:hypothetical protein n=1 Tax=Treponema bryantii TaxID=163 RepID=UPI002B27E69A|nr:hypothetical protein TRBR_15400 [Treponema bryantii]